MLASLLAVALALPVTNEDSSFEVAASARFSYVGYLAATAPALRDAYALEGAGGGSITAFLQRINDDDAPPALQPFLQYASDVTLSGGGGGVTHLRRVQAGPSADQSFGEARVGIGGYVTRWLTLDASFTIRYETYHEANDPL